MPDAPVRSVICQGVQIDRVELKILVGAQPSHGIPTEKGSFPRPERYQRVKFGGRLDEMTRRRSCPAPHLLSHTTDPVYDPAHTGLCVFHSRREPKSASSPFQAGRTTTHHNSPRRAGRPTAPDSLPSRHAGPIPRTRSSRSDREPRLGYSAQSSESSLSGSYAPSVSETPPNLPSHPVSLSRRR
jgi:hypothetical protein